MGWFSFNNASNQSAQAKAASVLIGQAGATVQLFAAVAQKYQISASRVQALSQQQVTSRKSQLWDLSARAKQGSMREREIDLELKALNGLDAGRVAITYENGEVVFDWI